MRVNDFEGSRLAKCTDFKTVGLRKDASEHLIGCSPPHSQVKHLFDVQHFFKLQEIFFAQPILPTFSESWLHQYVMPGV
jgi:hypothetical protein